MLTKISDAFMAQLSQKAAESQRRRINYNIHQSSAESIQRFLNAAEPGTYVRPHKHEHPPKIELFVLLQGRVLILEFDDSGTICDHCQLDAVAGLRVVEIPPQAWHSFICLTSAVLLEIKEGPFDPQAEKTFASWAPPEGSPESGEFNQRILAKLSSAGLITL